MSIFVVMWLRRMKRGNDTCGRKKGMSFYFAVGSIGKLVNSFHQGHCVLQCRIFLKNGWINDYSCWLHDFLGDSSFPNSVIFQCKLVLIFFKSCNIVALDVTKAMRCSNENGVNKLEKALLFKQLHRRLVIPMNLAVKSRCVQSRYGC